ncbi:SLBB domain-containing protein [Cytophagaceae bacterium ABcell3]|nr:SLBB domain-containing protein [Cytophagaceae bacterium ABcell3]
MCFFNTRIAVLFLVVFQLLFIADHSYGQQNLSARDLQNINVDELSDDQIRNFIKQAEKSGYSEQELEMAARAKGMKADQIAKLRERVNQLSMQQDSAMAEADNKEVIEDADDDHDVSLAKIKEQTLKAAQEDSVLRDSNRVYGFNLFNTKNLTFEPSINIPTPKNYQLGAGDELVIDIWGASQQNYRQTISREGTINIVGIGPVYVNGLNVDQASNRIINRLSSIYSGLKTSGGRAANTYAQVSLGRVRSIKVSLVGEVETPGTYTLSSLSTVFNALYVSGGPSENGSFRNIEVWRENKKIAVLDVYDFLVQGDQQNNIRLQDQDIIRIRPYDQRVRIEGEVKREGFFEMKKGETVEDLLEFAGGFSDRAYTNRVKIKRNTGKERRMLDILMADARNLILDNGDVVYVDPILDRFENRVEIVGAVFREGDFELSEGMTVKGLIDKADGLRGDAYLHRAAIYRTRDDFTIEVLPIDLTKIMNGESEDIELVREDLIRVSSIYELRDKFSVSISGDVHKEGDFPYMENLTLKDFILQAGGFKESASIERIEVARRVRNADPTSAKSKIAEVYHFDVDENLSLSDKDSEFVLSPFDHVYVRRAPGYEVQHNVEIEGEVLYPGRYAIQDKDERISDLLARSGGLTASAYPRGARLERKLANTGTVDIDLHKIMEKPKGDEDLILMEGDVLKIPLKLQTVKVKGEVLFPRSVRYEENRSFKNYVSQVGGFNKQALRRKTYVVYANGEVARTRNYLLFKDYPKVERGAEIIVPEKPERRKMTTQEALGLGTGFASLGMVIVTLINMLN